MPHLYILKKFMDRAAKDLFTGCCLTFLFLAVGLGLGSWLFLVEFGAAFNESSGDRVHRVVASSALVILNPFGSIGWFLGVKIWCLLLWGFRPSFLVRPFRQCSTGR